MPAMRWNASRTCDCFCASCALVLEILEAAAAARGEVLARRLDALRPGARRSRSRAPRRASASPSSRARARDRRAGRGGRRRRSRRAARRRCRRTRATRRRARAPDPSSPARPSPQGTQQLRELRMQRQEQRPPRLLGEVEVLREVPEDLRVLPHVGRGSGRPSVVGVEPLRRARKSSSMNFR